MAEPYLSNLTTLLEEVAPAGVASMARHFFSGAAAYTAEDNARGKIFMTLTPAGLALKLPPDDREMLMSNGGRELRYFPDGPIKRDYVLMSRAVAENPEDLRTWVAHSIAFVSGAS